MSTTDLRRAVEDFLYEEARLCDEHEYAAWEALWTDDATYWVPAAGGLNTDPKRQVSYIYDNRVRLRTRIGALLSGEKFSQQPKSGLSRVISNVVLGDRESNGDVRVVANFVLLESRREVLTWGGRVHYRLRPHETTFKLVEKKIILVNHTEPMRKMSFLL